MPLLFASDPHAAHHWSGLLVSSRRGNPSLTTLTVWQSVVHPFLSPLSRILGIHSSLSSQCCCAAGWLCFWMTVIGDRTATAWDHCASVIALLWHNKRTVALSSSPARRPRLQKSDTLLYLPLSLHHLRTHSLISVIDASVFFGESTRSVLWNVSLAWGKEVHRRWRRRRVVCQWQWCNCSVLASWDLTGAVSDEVFVYPNNNVLVCMVQFFPTTTLHIALQCLQFDYRAEIEITILEWTVSGSRND